MNDLGWTLIWQTFQVATLLVPALVLQAFASRQGPDLGSWMATWSLGLVVALAVAAFLPGIGAVVELTHSAGAVSPTAQEASGKPVALLGSGPPKVADSARPLLDLRAIGDRLGRRALGPSSRVHPWGRAVAVAVLGGMGLGLIRLILGFWAIECSRRHGGVVVDGSMNGLVEELRAAMGCRPAVEVREVADLATPATAGWNRPVLLIPNDWRSWGMAERRAVVAHEIAHILRGDFAAGLLARVALVLNPYNPLVHRMVGRLHLEQELAADALGARFAGGRAAYLVALSGLALKQDGRSPGWPARAFLPTRGTLIRRIAMLRNETRTGSTRDWSRTTRLTTISSLIALTVALAAWKSPAPAQGGDNTPSTAQPTESKPEATASELTYLPDSATAVVALHPASASHRPVMDRLVPLIAQEFTGDLKTIAKAMRVDLNQPGFLKLDCERIKSIFFDFDIGKSGAITEGTKSGQKLHSVQSSCLTVRMVAPFDWLAFLRQWKVEIVEIRDDLRVYYQAKLPQGALDFDFTFFVYLPDDRTLVTNSRQEWIGELIRQNAPPNPALLGGADWERANRGLLAVVMDLQGGKFIKNYDLGRPDDAVVLRCFEGVNRWVLGVADAAPLPIHAEATTRDLGAAESLARSINGLIKLGQAALDSTPTKADTAESLLGSIARKLLAFEVARQGESVTLDAKGSGIFEDIADLIKIEAEEDRVQVEATDTKPKIEQR